MFSNNKNNIKANNHKRFKTPSIIVADLNISGDLYSQGAIELGGKVEGNVRCNIVTIRKGADIFGDVLANDLVVQGKVSGIVKAKNITLSGTAEIFGEVYYENLTILSGANINGSCKKTTFDEAYLLESENKESLEYIPTISQVMNEKGEEQKTNKKTTDKKKSKANKKTKLESSDEVIEIEITRNDNDNIESTENKSAEDITMHKTDEDNLFEIDLSKNNKKDKKKKA